MSFVVAIDGPAGTGKGTITKLIADELGLINIDTGAMYRCVALEALRRNINETEIKKIEDFLKYIKIEFRRNKEELIVLLNGEDVSKEIRTPAVNGCVAKFAALQCVREAMTPLQRQMKEQGNIIMEGRDIGTTIFPDADVKVYLDATIEERANRRYKQNLKKGIHQTFEEVLESMKQRHILETTREISPLRKADDAIYIDTTNMTIEEEKKIIIKLIKDKMNQNA